MNNKDQNSRLNDLLRNEIKKKNYKIGIWLDIVGNFNLLELPNFKVPKKPINCYNCKILFNKDNGKLIPRCFAIKQCHKHLHDLYDVYICLRCSQCGHITFMRYLEYLEIVNPTLEYIKRNRMKEYDKRKLEIIQGIYKVDEEEAKKIKKRNDDGWNRTKKKMEEERNIRLIGYEDEERKRKSEEKKRLIQSGELLYDKRNKVFYYKSTGKVYQ